MQTATPSPGGKQEIDPFRILEYPAAIFALNITVFTIVWKAFGLTWLPYGLDDSFRAVFSEGYYPRDMQRNEQAYNLFFLLTYGVLGTAAQIASLRIASHRRQQTRRTGVARWTFVTFHVVIAVYHVLFVFRFVEGKMLLDDVTPWQMLATKVLYVMELAMAVECIFTSERTFYRRKVCLDLVSACNLLPLLFFWGFVIANYQDETVNTWVSLLFFAAVPLLLFCTEWLSWFVSRCGFPRLRPHA